MLALFPIRFLAGCRISSDDLLFHEKLIHGFHLFRPDLDVDFEFDSLEIEFLVNNAPKHVS